jgi:hypothetical protein
LEENQVRGRGRDREIGRQEIKKERKNWWLLGLEGFQA